MNNPAQKILSLFLVVLMLAFTVGVSVYEHICNCSNQRIASVFVEVTCSDNQHEICCSEKPLPEKSCCSESSQNSCEHETTCDAEGCCKTESSFFQIETEYQVSQAEAVGLGLFIVKIIAETAVNPEPEINSFIEGYYTDTSPPVYGRQFLTAVHQLKLDLPVC